MRVTSKIEKPPSRGHPYLTHTARVCMIQKVNSFEIVTILGLEWVSNSSICLWFVLTFLLESWQLLAILCLRKFTYSSLSDENYLLPNTKSKKFSYESITRQLWKQTSGTRLLRDWHRDSLNSGLQHVRNMWCLWNRRIKLHSS